MSDDLARGRWLVLGFICFGVVGSLTTWFSMTAVMPQLQADWGFSVDVASWMTNAVQLGFVSGALVASLVNLPDIVRMNYLMAASALLAAACNGVLLLEPGVTVAIISRFLTGVALAGIYPSGIKLMATWFQKGRGLALGFLVGALTLGSSVPHFFRALSASLDWQVVIIASSLAALGAAILFFWRLHEGPYAFGKALFDPKQSLKVFREPPLLLANIGYLGHMWELYAMWAWFLVFATAAESQLVPFPFQSASMLTFIVIGAGAVGCLLGGFLSDRIGRCATTILMMCASALAAVLIGFAFDGPAWLLAIIAIFWGITIIGDSAQFSAAVTELADQRFVGTALALQMSLGFALTIVSIWLLPIFAGLIGGWQWSFLLLAPGPVIGVIAMLRLRGLPQAEKMAGGLR